MFGANHPELNKAVFEMLKVHCGQFKISISFDGGGDSGQIHDITTEGLVDLSKVQVTPKVTAAWDKATRTGTYSHRAPDWADVNEFLESYAELLLQQYGDWVNNDGAYGEIVIHPYEGTIQMEVNERYTSSRLHQYNFTNDGVDVTEEETEYGED